MPETWITGRGIEEPSFLGVSPRVPKRREPLPADNYPALILELAYNGSDSKRGEHSTHIPDFRAPDRDVVRIGADWRRRRVTGFSRGGELPRAGLRRIEKKSD